MTKNLFFRIFSTVTILLALVSISRCAERKPLCIAGTSSSCACPGTSRPGAQICNPNGTFGPCDCSPPKNETPLDAASQKPAAATAPEEKSPAAPVQPGAEEQPQEAPQAPAEAAAAEKTVSPASEQAGAAVPKAEKRRNFWLTSPFQCRAISTARYRRCRFERGEDGRHSLSFSTGVRCADVVFDTDGNPSELLDCKDPGITIPRRIRLRMRERPEKTNIWAGGLSGWSWTDSGEKYCCPGIWLLEPEKEAEKK